MSWCERKMNVAALAGLLLAGSELSAQTISWGPNAAAVPMGPVSMAIMAALFLVIGIWVLSKTRHHAQSFMVIAALTIGVYNFTAEAIGVGVSITTSTGTGNLVHGVNIVQNNYTEDIKIIAVDPHICTLNVAQTTCTAGAVLTPTQTCTVTLSCPA